MNEKKRIRLTKRQKDFLTIFRNNACRITVSCLKANISRGSYHKWYNENSLFNEEVEKSREEFLDFGEGQFIQLLKDKHPQIVLHFAKTKLRERGYAEKQEIDVSGGVLEFIKEWQKTYNDVTTTKGSESTNKGQKL